MRLLKLAAVWALTGSAFAALIWSALAALLWPFYYRAGSFLEGVAEVPLAFVGSAFWALVIGAVAAPAYCLVFAGWLLLLRRFPRWDATAGRRAAAALALAAPPAALLIEGFGSSLGFPFDWGEAARIAPLAVLSCWGGALLPRRTVRALRGPLVAPAV